MREKLIDFETAKLAKEKGFYVISPFGYSNGNLMEYDICAGSWFDPTRNRHIIEEFDTFIYAPTQSLLEQWLRDIHEIDISIEPVWGDIKQTKREYIPWVHYRAGEEGEDEDPIYFDSYEKALEQALVEALELIKVKKKFYRVCNEETLRGLWYDYQGIFTGIIHEDFDFCTNSSLKMDFDPELVGWLSATDNLEELYKWFTEADIKRLQNFGWYIHEFEAEDYKFYEKFQHLIIKQDTSKVIKKIQL